MIFSRTDYRSKVLGCWLGKNIGGTLGAPFEWKRQVNNVNFYTQDLKGEPLPNDDLDLQLLWLMVLENNGLDITAHDLAEQWCLHVPPHWSEYGIARTNMRSGLPPPLCGTYRNNFKDSCGAFIRSEIWACIAPAMPMVAARYACEDAIIDHGNGEGTYAAVFCATLESAAFATSDLRELIHIGMSHIPENCETAKAVRTAIECFDKGRAWLAARDEVLRQHRGSTFGWPGISPEDRQKGFADGKLGLDAPANIGMLVIALLYGHGDFGQTVCLATNCGEDTDCTAATAGAIFGIIHGAEKIPQKWIEPIGRGIKTIAINAGDIGGYLPKTVDELTLRTERIALQVVLRHASLGVDIRDREGSDLTGLDLKKLHSQDGGNAIYQGINGPRYKFGFFTVTLDYGDAPTIKAAAPKTVKVSIENNSFQMNLALRWHLPDGWTIEPGRESYILSLRRIDDGSGIRTCAFVLRADRVEKTINRAVLAITMEGRPGVHLVPVALLNGNAD